MKKINHLLTLLLLMGTIFFTGCDENAQTREESRTPQGIQLNITLDNSVQKNNPKRFEKQADIVELRLDVEGASGFIYQNKLLQKIGDKWSANLLLDPNRAPFLFTARAFGAGNNLIYEGLKSLQTLSTLDINLTLQSTEPLTITRLSFVEAIDKTVTAQGYDLNFTIVNYQRDTLSYKLYPLNVDPNCSSPFTPDIGQLPFSVNVTKNNFSTTFVPDNNSSCQTLEFALMMIHSTGDIVVTPFKFENPDFTTSTIDINLPPDIRRVIVIDNNDSFEVGLDVVDPDGTIGSLHYNWRVLEGIVNVVPTTDQKQVLYLENYSGVGRIVLDVNVSDDGGAVSRIKYVLRGDISSGTSKQQKVMFINYSKEHNQSELWGLDDFEKPYMVKVLDNRSVVSSNRLELCDSLQIGNSLYFSADDGVHGDELWRSDGTTQGTFMVKDIDLYGGSYPNQLTNFNGTLYFSADDGAGVHETELWESNGSKDGTKMVKDIYTNGHSNPRNFTNLNGKLYFSAYNGVYGRELWESNGSKDGTKIVKDINPNGDSYPSNFTNLNGKLYFSAYNGVYGRELWESNGSKDGTKIVKDIYTNGDSSPIYLTNLNGTLYFLADSDGVHGDELWESNGSKDGTKMVKDINPYGNSYPNSLTNVNGTLYFLADSDGVHGDELWESNRSKDGTKMVKDINPNGNSDPDSLTNVNGTLYFLADSDGDKKFELWSSNRTTKKTSLIKKTTIDSPFYYPLININNRLYYIQLSSANKYEYELWTSDGTPAGTKKIFPTTP